MNLPSVSSWQDLSTALEIGLPQPYPWQSVKVPQTLLSTFPKGLSASLAGVLLGVLLGVLAGVLHELLLA